MNVQGQNFYVDCFKFAFSLIGGGTAGFCLAKGVNAMLVKAAAVGEMKVAQKMMKQEESETQDSLPEV